ncbi:hypothetical protein Q4566_07675 [Tamlana sp. 2_MG-2023]|uniref:hypothetical protein n=1 Tax=unclassified Tamlana TaxID=2614803 RepID=UPI0026E3518D|nr:MULTISPECIES: hypothetical protein [unclassified Tamlana]MDO6760076.1 hypothetical protein [Tamlana sp. 2_MG-2023]MDO6790226.1 hypothetical protein [Tamlana sp. 1_MG-2023]
MKTNKLHNDKSTGFKVPEGYFDTLDDKIMSQVKNNLTLDTGAENGFKVPKDYFNTVDERIIKRIENGEKTAKVIPIFNKKTILFASSIAAAVLLLFNLSVFESNKPSFNNLDVQTVENYIIYEDISTSELATLFTVEELDETVLSESVFDDENIEDYLLNHADIENLLTE